MPTNKMSMNLEELQQCLMDFQVTWCRSQNPDHQLMILSDMAHTLGLHVEFKMTPKEELKGQDK